MLRLVDRFPSLGAEELIDHLVPPKRFSAVRFETYVPSAEHPSQKAALEAIRAFAATLHPDAAAPRRRFLRRREEPAGVPGRYLDGGFGVGKTHLLASLWHASPEPKAYLTFEELAAVNGFVGMDDAIETFRQFRVVCIDEFELDDVANTLMVVSFLRGILPRGVKIAATSNAIPDRLGEGRFNAEDFTREIAAIASAFEVFRIDGPDYRAKSRVSAETLDVAEVERLISAAGEVTVDDFGSLLAHLRKVHPVQFRALIGGLDAVVVHGLAPIANQGEALLFVQLVDELYDAEVAFAATGCAVHELFPETYRHGGYRKKYGRCESRLAAMLGEADRAFLS
ncbi:MAG: cell division protein ZapE [Acidimicrobiia bacterium]